MDYTLRNTIMNLQLRNYNPGDEPVILELFQAADAVDKAEQGVTASDLSTLLTAPYINPEKDFFIADADGVPVGVVLLEHGSGAIEDHRVLARGVVHPEYRRHRVGACLLQAAETRVREILSAYDDDRPRYLETFCRSYQADRIALFESFGLSPARYFFDMQCDLRQELPQPFTPDGFTIRTYRPEDSESARLAFDEAFRDHWGAAEVTREMWRNNFLGVPHFRPELWFLACEGDETAGFTYNFIDPAYVERVGRKEGLVAEVGVRRPWRKRGLATSLLTHTLRALRSAGMEYALLGVDADNPNKAGAIYERQGFRKIRQSIVFRKLLK